MGPAKTSNVAGNEAKELARNAAAANTFSHMTSPEKAQKLLDELRSLPDQILDRMAALSGVPDADFPIHRALARGEPNPFVDELSSVDGLLQPGDVILMTGMSPQSQALASAQKLIYSNARSSHVALVHADFVCIDAMPRVGTTNRLVSEVLIDAKEDWRVIRFKRLTSKGHEVLMRSCGFFLWQRYSIQPSRKSLKKFSYCSELARKIYLRAGIDGTGIPDSLGISPANFDRLADTHTEWRDVTEEVRPAVEFCRKRPEIVQNLAKLFIDGLKLNRARYEERAGWIRRIEAQANAGKISKEKAHQMTREIKAIEEKLNNRFWDAGSGNS